MCNVDITGASGGDVEAEAVCGGDVEVPAVAICAATAACVPCVAIDGGSGGRRAALPPPPWVPLCCDPRAETVTAAPPTP